MLVSLLLLRQVVVSGETSTAAKPAAVAETISGKAAAMSDSAAFPNASNSAAKPVESDDNSPAARADTESSALSELRSRLECKPSQTDVNEFLQNLRISENWRGMESSSHQVRAAMLKFATHFGAARRKDRQVRNPADLM